MEGSSGASRFLRSAHVGFIASLDAKRGTFEHVMSTHFRLSGVYWGACALSTMGALDSLDRSAGLAFIDSCAAPAGGWSGAAGHDAHLLYTLSALQLRALWSARLSVAEAASARVFVRSLQRVDGSFSGDSWGEVDTRFTYCALQCAALLASPGLVEVVEGAPARSLDDTVDVKAAVDFLVACGNFDGGFGAVPGAESHAGQVFCAVGALAIAGALDRVDADLLGWWLAERQCDSGGLNGRPEKQSDVCYSWWILSALDILGRKHWIDGAALSRFILDAQDDTPGSGGGIADRPGNVTDVFHTFFGIAGLSLLGSLDGPSSTHDPIDAVYALPASLVVRLGLPRSSLPAAPVMQL